MMLIAVYFLLSVTIMPQCADIDKIYRLAMYQGEAHSQSMSHALLFSVLALAAFVGGFALKLKTIRSSS
jgi:predicted transporter